MVFNVIEWVLLGISLIWLGVLSLVFFRMQRHYKALRDYGDDASLITILEHILKNQEFTKNELKDLSGRIIEIDALNKKQISHIGINRFNPFSDTGGNQSFTIALLDEENAGIVMTSLYARTGNRWYVKRVQNGEGSEVALSREEKAAIREAKRV